MVVGKCVSKENPTSDLDLDLGFVNIISYDMKYDTIMYGTIKSIPLEIRLGTQYPIQLIWQ